MTGGGIVQINGIDLYFERRGEGAPLLLLHGGGGAGANWRLIFDRPPQGYQLIVPDFRGHGRSTNPNRTITFRQLALDTMALLDRLEIDRVQAIGMSMGAKTLLHMATQQPDRVEAMVLVSATPYFPESTRLIMRTVASAAHSEAEWAQMREWHVHGDAQIKALREMPDQLANDYEDMSFTPPRLGQIRARTLIVHGDRDPLYPVSLAMELHASIRGSYLWVVPNGGHGPIFGDLSPQFVRTALGFLSGGWARGPTQAADEHSQGEGRG
jgi:pimeloyl-ACP methyl ester carboxylesterase